MRSLTSAARNMRRTPYQTIAAFVVITISFFIINLIAFVSLGVSQIVTYFETRPQVIVFFETTAPEAEILELKSSLEQNGNVSEVTYTNQQQALALYQEQNKNDPALLELINPDIFPPSLEVSTKSIDTLQTVANSLQDAKHVEEIVFNSDVVASLKKWTSGLRVAGIALVGVLAVTCVLIVTVVVGMKVAQRKQERGILRLLGATSGFVNAPYVIEGVLYGMISGLLGFGLAATLLLYLTPFIVEFASGIPILPANLNFVAIVAGSSVFISSSIGFIGSKIALLKHS